MLFIHPTVSGQAFYLFRCREVQLGGGQGASSHYLVVDYRLTCYDARWAGFAALGGLVVALFSVGYPTLIVYILWKRRAALDARATKVKWGVFYLAYKPSAFLFEAFQMLHKVALWGSLVFFGYGSQLQLLVAVSLCFVRLLVHARLQPYESFWLNILDYAVLTFVTCLGLSGLTLNYLDMAKSEAVLRRDDAALGDWESLVAGVEVSTSVFVATTVLMALVVNGVMFVTFLKSDRYQVLQARVFRRCRRFRRRCCAGGRCCGGGGGGGGGGGRSGSVRSGSRNRRGSSGRWRDSARGGSNTPPEQHNRLRKVLEMELGSMVGGGVSGGSGDGDGSTVGGIDGDGGEQWQMNPSFSVEREAKELPTAMPVPATAASAWGAVSSA
eukprot:g179.t1